MYYKLPIKERIELMKAYKKANPDMSYRDMVNDYNTSYEKFGDGGKSNLQKKNINLNIKSEESFSPVNGWNENLDWLGEKYNDVGLDFNKNNLTVGIGNYIPRNTFEKVGNINPYLNLNYDINDKTSIGANFSKDYNGISLIKKFDNGGKREPIYTNNPNDPRIRAYNDSLSSYNFNKVAFDKLYKTGKTPKGTSVDLSSKRYVTRAQGINEDFNDLKGLLPNVTKQLISDDWDYVDTKKGKLNRSVGAFKFKFIDSPGDFTLKQYKKPVQPYIYKKPEELEKPKVEIKNDTLQYLPMIKDIPSLNQSMIEPEIQVKKQEPGYRKVSWRYDPYTKLQVPVLLTDPKMKVNEGQRIYNKDVPSTTGAVPQNWQPDFNIPQQFERTDPYWRSKYLQNKQITKK